VMSLSLSANTGSASTPFNSSHTRDIAYLGLAQDAEIFYEVRIGGIPIFHGSFFGMFSDT